MGFGSIGILLHEMIKLVRYAECDDPIFIRVGTCGGIGIPPGIVVVTEGALNGMLKGVHEFVSRVKYQITFLSESSTLSFDLDNLRKTR